MKRKLLPRVLSVLLAFSMVTPAFATAVAEIEYADSSKENTSYNKEQFDNRE